MRKSTLKTYTATITVESFEVKESWTEKALTNIPIIAMPYRSLIVDVLDDPMVSENSSDFKGPEAEAIQYLQGLIAAQEKTTSQISAEMEVEKNERERLESIQRICNYALELNPSLEYLTIRAVEGEDGWFVATFVGDINSGKAIGVGEDGRRTLRQSLVSLESQLWIKMRRQKKKEKTLGRNRRVNRKSRAGKEKRGSQDLYAGAGAGDELKGLVPGASSAVGVFV
ncbi:hypothetical protein P280DRAFT_479058 [Massarina eburnea CBS 473.64]|uniref:Uncharacterized protein n=1 Tax=Massarina eburnea CBS 473.64 TaxID=1395130 RepID=A0A6A6S395_9PLEO|nr:hypothetical protein P280DRAFT_479058 [Massarina eburnea CBS 473.64]